MKYREDITEYLISRLGDYYKNKDFKFYEQDGLIYMANYSYENEDLSYFTDYSLLWFKGGEEIKQDIIKNFNVKFAPKYCNIICKCGNDKNFSAHYGGYVIFLICNSCGNEFVAYSG
jgi:hypothetical protein